MDTSATLATSVAGRLPIKTENLSKPNNQTSKGWYGTAIALGILLVLGGIFGGLGLLQAHYHFLPSSFDWLAKAVQYVGNLGPHHAVLWTLVGSGVLGTGAIAGGSYKVHNEVPNSDSSTPLNEAFGTAQKKELQLQAGKHTIKLLHGTKTVKEITTNNPIYFCPDAKLPGMKKPGCLVMSKEDFMTIKNLIHGGAFGCDYTDIDNETVAVWKIPADLKEIEGWVLPLKITPVSVGTYGLVDDTKAFLAPSQQAPLPDNNIPFIEAEKIRNDLPNDVNGKQPSVHHLAPLREMQKIPAFSTGNLFENFNNPKDDERLKAGQLLQDLDRLGIKAFMCNGCHHLVVLYKNSNGDLLKPEDVVEMLQDATKGPSIIEAFQKAGKSDFDAKAWAQSFILCYRPEL